MKLVEKFGSMEEEEFRETLEDMPLWIKFVLRIFYRKAQRMKKKKVYLLL